ncbi:galactarate dehydratase [Roseateles sp.]|uniref:galactarate dehydratase n=1 Tax=Roseateles sp. TaxID=1971397 RepID=UPI00393D64BE
MSVTPVSAPLCIRVHPSDNVAVVANDGGLPAGTRLPDEFGGLSLLEAVPQGHKVLLADQPEGAEIRRYGVVIGRLLAALPAGSWVHERRLQMPDARGLVDLPMATRAAPTWEPLNGHTFEGYRNPDGSVGTRNLLAITTTVQCVAGVVRHAAERIRRELLPRYPNVDGVVALEHSYGCGVAIDAPDAVIPIRTLRHISLNPNFGGEAMVVSLGCEKLPPQRLLPAESIPIERVPGGLGQVCLQEQDGFAAQIEAICRQAELHLARLNARRREIVPASELVVGVQCGGSDALSGLTANPAVGYCADLLVRAGATIMFSENTEVRDGIAQLTARAATPAVAEALVREMAWYDAYLQRGQVDRSANTTPGNKAGGLSNIVEKAMGSIVKSGSAAIRGVLAPGEKLAPGQRGLIYTATPASDFICGTLQMAAGMSLHVFTTGRGTPYGLEAVPVIKVATRNDLARRWHDLMDLNAGRIATGEATIESVGWELFQMLLDVASGKKKTWAEHWALHNALVLFNPAPVT